MSKALEKINEVIGEYSKIINENADEILEIKEEKDHRCGSCKLEKDEFAVYSFWHKSSGEFLKIGQCTKNSAPRFSNQHYRCHAAQSTLANSLAIHAKEFKIPGVPDDYFEKITLYRKKTVSKEEKEKLKKLFIEINEKYLEKWIVENCIRVNIKMKLEPFKLKYKDRGEKEAEFALNLLESLLHYRLKPRFEGKDYCKNQSEGETVFKK